MSAQHDHEIDNKLHADCPACDYIREVTDPKRAKAEREVENDLGQIMKTALKARPGRKAKYH